MKSYRNDAQDWWGKYGFVLVVTGFGEDASGDVISQAESLVAHGGWAVAEDTPVLYGVEGTFVAGMADPIPGTDGSEVRVQVYVEVAGRRFLEDAEPDVVAMARQAAETTARAVQTRLRYTYPETRVRAGDAFRSKDVPSWTTQ